MHWVLIQSHRGAVFVDHHLQFKERMNNHESLLDQVQVHVKGPRQIYKAEERALEKNFFWSAQYRLKIRNREVLWEGRKTRAV